MHDDTQPRFSFGWPYSELGGQPVEVNDVQLSDLLAEGFRQCLGIANALAAADGELGRDDMAAALRSLSAQLVGLQSLAACWWAGRPHADPPRPRPLASALPQNE